ncbi:MAG: RNA pseudouridine synthase, partial [Rikenellaceae bacterium]
MDNPVKLHRFTEQTYEIVPPKRFTFVFNYVPHPLVVMAAKQLRGYLSGRKEWHGEISRGKMFGVLVVRDSQGELGFLAAFSGLLDKSNTHSYFVPPIYDMHHPLGHFRTEEAQISEINRQIHWIESSGEYISEYNRLQSEILDWKEQVGKAQEEYHTAKKERKAIRTQGVETTHLEALRAQSQYQKAELKRLKQKAQSQIEIVQAKIELLQSEIRNLQDQRAKRSKDLQQWLFDQFVVSNNSKQTSSLSQIFQNYGATTPPAGAGECACPKLLQYAYLNNLTPMAMGEFWQGESPKGEVRHHGEFYPSCNAKCKPILGFMLQGLEIDPDPHAKNQSIEELQVVYQDPYLMVVNKPEGVLSVRGKAASESIESLIPRLFPQ